LKEQIDKVIETAVASGLAAMSADAKITATMFMETDAGGDPAKVNRTFLKMEGMKKSANAVVSVLKRPSSTI
jgi:hypothetical protein